MFSLCFRFESFGLVLLDVNWSWTRYYSLCVVGERDLYKLGVGRLLIERVTPQLA
jgi:hypothetical protein